MAYLRDIDGGALLAKSLRGFSDEIDKTRAELDVLVARGDLAGVARILHKLLGLANTLAAHTLAEELRWVEGLAETGDADAVADYLQDVELAMASTQAHIGVLLKENEAA